MKRLIAVILAALLLCTGAACSSDGGADTAAVDNGPFEEIDASKLPSKVDLRDYDGKCYVTSVKSQRFGDCWTFSLAGSAEIAYLYANDMGVPAGEINDKVDFSEKYIAWYLFHGITEDDAAIGRVRASQVGEGFDPSEAEKNHEFAAYNFGGPCVHGSNLFGSGFGPVDESVSVKGEYPYAYNDSSSVEWWLPLNAEYRCTPTDAVLRNSRILDSPASVDADGAYVFDEDALTAVKWELYKGHGVSLGMSTRGGYNLQNRAAYHSEVVTPDHAVTVVGYDDSCSKDNFTVKTGDGTAVEGTTPPADGAFIIKNSWGISESEEDGYFYLSYYDRTIVSLLSYEFDSTAEIKHTDPNYDQYDLMMTQWYGVTDYDTETKTANVFDAEADESLYQIAYITASPMTEVSYAVYKDVGDSDPSSGTLLEQGVSRHTYAGCHRVDLKGEYALKKGDKYSIVLTMKRAGDGGTDVYTEVFPYSTEFSTGLTVRGIINEGESWLYTDGKWSDMTSAEDSLIERAYKQFNAAYDPVRMPSDIKRDSKDTFTVDNYPIKAILAPEK